MCFQQADSKLFIFREDPLKSLGGRARDFQSWGGLVSLVDCTEKLSQKQMVMVVIGDLSVVNMTCLKLLGLGPEFLPTSLTMVLPNMSSGRFLQFECCEWTTLWVTDSACE